MISMIAIALISFVAQTACVIVRKEHCDIGHHKRPLLHSWSSNLSPTSHSSKTSLPPSRSSETLYSPSQCSRHHGGLDFIDRSLFYTCMRTLKCLHPVRCVYNELILLAITWLRKWLCWRSHPDSQVSHLNDNHICRFT